MCVTACARVCVCVSVCVCVCLSFKEKETKDGGGENTIKALIKAERAHFDFPIQF